LLKKEISAAPIGPVMVSSLIVPHSAIGSWVLRVLTLVEVTLLVTFSAIALMQGSNRLKEMRYL